MQNLIPIDHSLFQFPESRILAVVNDRMIFQVLTLGEKIETVGTSIHTRLNQLESGLARVDERTKK